LKSLSLSKFRDRVAKLGVQAFDVRFDKEKQMNSETALFELTVMDAESSSYEFEDFYIWGEQKGIPVEVLTRLRSLWDSTQSVGGGLVSIGKVIISTIRDFLLANPKLSAGLVIGLSVAYLISAIPILGPVLGGIAALYSTGVGASLDEGMALNDVSSLEAIKALLSKAFSLLVEVINAVGDQWDK
jgi:hypothetical protein